MNDFHADPDRWARIESIFHDVLDAPSDERTARLRLLAGDDAELRADVERLLREYEDADTFLEQPAAETFAERLGSFAESLVGETIGRYTVKSVLGEGGMGVVLRARQDAPERDVALKLIRPGYVTEATLRRFEHEAQVLGRLRHPGIAQIYEFSTAEVFGAVQPYFALELVQGVPVTAWVEASGATRRRRLELIAEMCDAVHDAHQRGVIHRDIKPANVLVDAHGRIKVLDFGVARLVDEAAPAHTRMTHTSDIVGTLQYMSPEQLGGDPDEVDTRADVYSLGAVAYELLSGTRPFESESSTLAMAVRALADREPKPLGAIDRTLRGDVETMVLKAMDRDKSRRYGSASEFAADIRRYLNHEPISARRASAAYQLRRFARRHRPVVIAAGVIVLAVAGWLATALWQSSVARSRKAQIEEVNEFFREMILLIDDPVGSHDPRLLQTAQRADAKAADAFRGLPLAEADVREVLGTAYYRLGRIDDAERQFSRAFELYLPLFGEDDRRTLAAMSGLASTHLMQGRLDDADAMLGRVVRGRRRVIGPHHEKTLNTMADLARVRVLRGETDDATERYEQVLQLYRDHVGAEDRNTMAAATNLAELYERDDRLEDAEPLYREAAETLERTLGLTHPDACRAMERYAVMLKRAGRLEEAQPWYEKSFAGFRRSLGFDHPSTITSAYNYGTFLWNRRDRPRALELLGAATEAARRELGLSDPLTTAVGLRYGIFLKREDQYAEAEAVLLAVHEGLQRHNDSPVRELDDVIAELISVYDRWDKPEQADVWRETRARLSGE